MKVIPAAALFLLLGCRGEDPESQVRAAFEACRRAVEEGRAEPVMERLGKDFRGPEGMDKAQARLFLMGTLRRQKVGVTVLSTSVHVQGKTAHQVVDLVLTGIGGGLLPEEASRRTLHLIWCQEKSGWRLLEVQEERGA